MCDGGVKLLRMHKFNREVSVNRGNVKGVRVGSVRIGSVRVEVVGGNIVSFCCYQCQISLLKTLH